MDFSKIKAFAFDIDGVMTDGSILCFNDGDLFRTYDAKDSFAVRMAVMNGYRLAVITGGVSDSIKMRFKTLGIPEEDIFLGCRDKMKYFNSFCERYSLKAEEVMYFGDDLPDLSVIKAAGIGVCPSDACAEAKAAADYIDPYPGGKGCIRHCFEEVMRSQGKWEFEVDYYEKRF